MASGKNGKTEHRNITHTTFSKMVRRVIQIPVEPRWAKLDKQSIAPCFFRKHSNAGDCKQGGARLRLVTLRDFFLWCHDSWDINRTFYILLFKPYWLKHIVKDIYMLHVHWCKEGLGSGMSSSFIISRWSLLAPHIHSHQNTQILQNIQNIQSEMYQSRPTLQCSVLFKNTCRYELFTLWDVADFYNS